jgi:hypothetical protein
MERHTPEKAVLFQKDTLHQIILKLKSFTQVVNVMLVCKDMHKIVSSLITRSTVTNYYKSGLCSLKTTEYIITPLCESELTPRRKVTINFGYLHGNLGTEILRIYDKNIENQNEDCHQYRMWEYKCGVRMQRVHEICNEWSGNQISGAKLVLNAYEMPTVLYLKRKDLECEFRFQYEANSIVVTREHRGKRNGMTLRKRTERVLPDEFLELAEQFNMGYRIRWCIIKALGIVENDRPRKKN